MSDSASEWWNDQVELMNKDPEKYRQQEKEKEEYLRSHYYDLWGGYANHV